METGETLNAKANVNLKQSLKSSAAALGATRIPCKMRALILLLFTLALAQPAGAQLALDTAPRIYLGGGVLPGTGVFLGYEAPRLVVFSVEGALYADYTPRLVGGSGRLLVSGGLGGSVRALRIASIVTDLEPGPLDLDAGIRLGPSFYYAFFRAYRRGRSPLVSCNARSVRARSVPTRALDASLSPSSDRKHRACEEASAFNSERIALCYPQKATCSNVRAGSCTAVRIPSPGLCG